MTTEPTAPTPTPRRRRRRRRSRWRTKWTSPARRCRSRSVTRLAAGSTRSPVSFAHHLSDELRGNPNVFVSNKPGANTLVAVRSVIDKDYRDNQVDIVVVISTLIQQSILGGVSEFDAANDLVYLGAPDYTPSDQTWCIRSDVADSLDAYLAGNFTLGQIGRVDTYATSSEWAVQVGFPFERVFGYTGTSDMDAAFNRREIEVTPTCRDSQVAQNPEWAEGYATPLFYTVMSPSGSRKARQKASGPGSSPSRKSRRSASAQVTTT